MPASGLVDTHREVSGLLGVYLPIAIAVFVLVVGALAFVVWRYRHRPGRPVSTRDRAPRLELAYVLAIAAIAALLVAMTFRTESRVDALAASPALRIDAIASDWRWRFDYPQQAISQVGRGQAPVVLYVPAGQTVEFDLTSRDVIHAFYIPSQDFQRQAIPQIVNRFDLVFPRPGLLDGSCNEFCGLGHTQMLFSVHVLSATAFAAWVVERRRQGSGG